MPAFGWRVRHYTPEKWARVDLKISSKSGEGVLFMEENHDPLGGKCPLNQDQCRRFIEALLLTVVMKQAI